jgi:hypothetical protein
MFAKSILVEYLRYFFSIPPENFLGIPVFHKNTNGKQDV